MAIPTTDPGGVPAPSAAAWENQFRAPSLSEVRGHYLGQALEFFDKLFATMGALEGLAATFEWTGLPWRWSWVFRQQGAAVTDRPWAVLVPMPDAPRVAVPIDIEVFESIPSRTLSKYLRDGIASAVQVGEVRWPEWPVTTPTQLGDVQNLLKHKHKRTIAAAPKAG